MKTTDADKIHDLSFAPKVFKFEGLYGNAFLIIILPSVLFIIGIREFLYGHYIGGLVLAAIISFFLTLGYFQVLVKADIVIDNQWISRFAFGRMIQNIRWDNIELISVFGEFGGSGYGYNIYPIGNKRSRLGLSRKLAFGSDMKSADEFITIMNSQIAKYNIKIESILGGKKTHIYRLPEIKR